MNEGSNEIDALDRVEIEKRPKEPLLPFRSLCIYVASSNVVEGTVSSCDARKESQVASIMFKMQNILVFSIACTRTVV